MLYFKNIIAGFFLIVLGIYTIKDVRKNPDTQLKSVTVGRYVSGSTSVILGILLALGVLQIFD